MTVLALDTASPAPAVALADGDVVFLESLPADRGASEELLPAIERVLADGRLALSDCDRIAVCGGPGSFTGLRVGLATAWALARSVGRSVESVSTLEAMAEAARAAGASEVLVALDAGRGEAVAAAYSLSSRRARAVLPPRRLPLGELPSLSEGRLCIALPADLVAGALPPTESPAAALAKAVAREPGPAAVGMSPFYSRSSAAEEKHGAAPA
jgi:tRNA threonylcarbamoyl adenosine modification protein YeaZ